MKEKHVLKINQKFHQEFFVSSMVIPKNTNKHREHNDNDVNVFLSDITTQPELYTQQKSMCTNRE